MKEKLRVLLPYALVLAADFYLSPYLVQLLPAVSAVLLLSPITAILLLICSVPVTAFLCGLVCGRRHGFQPVLLVFAAVLLFLPSVPPFRNWIYSWPYASAYWVVTLAGNALGEFLYQRCK